MKKAKVFRNGQSQAIRLPKEFRFDDTEVYIRRIGDIVLLVPKKNPLSSVREAVEAFSDDFFDNGRCQGVSQKRDSLE